MSFDMGFYLVDHRLITLGVIVLLAVAGEVGFRRGVRHRDSQDSIRSLMSGTGAAMLGLLGLLLGFTLSMALSRWDARRDVIVNEANDVIDLHELRLASIENFLPAPLFLLLWTVSAISMGFLAWAFGAANQGGRTAVVMLGLLIGAVLLLIMDVNRPQRGRIEIGVDSLERVGESMATPVAHEGPGTV